MKAVIIFLLFISTGAVAQQTTEMSSDLENPAHPKLDELKPDNVIANYLKYDFSDLLIPRSEFLGYIGTDYRRIRVNFNSIVKSESKPDLYKVIGQTTVYNNTCDFEGMIIIELCT